MLRKYVGMKLGLILFGVWLVLTGLLPLLDISFSGADVILALLALAAAVLILFGVSQRDWAEEWGMLLLALWLLLSALFVLLDVSFANSDTLLSVLAVAAGIMILVGLRNNDPAENLGLIATAIWLIAVGLIPLLDITFANSATFLNVLAVAAGILILVDR